MEATAKLRNLKGSPRKARLVIDLIRGENVSRALSILKFTDRRAAEPIAQCLNSAIANATYKAEQENIAIDPDDLWINSCFVDMGPHKNRRRMRPAPQGRAYREQRHYCHITIQVTSDEKPKTEKELRAEAAKAKKAAAPKKETKQKAPAKKAAAPKKETKKAEAEEVMTPPAEEVVDIAAVGEAAEEIREAAPAVEAAEETTAVEAAAEQAAENGAKVADAKNVETQTTAALDETKPADDKQEDVNEELERQ